MPKLTAHPTGLADGNGGSAVWGPITAPERLWYADNLNTIAISASALGNSNVFECTFDNAFDMIPSDADILGFKLDVVRYAQTGTIYDINVQMMKAGSAVGDDKSIAGSWSSSSDRVSYGNSRDLWGTTWTVSDVQDPNFGISFQTNWTGGIFQGEIDLLQLSVYWSNRNTRGYMTDFDTDLHNSDKWNYLLLQFGNDSGRPSADETLDHVCWFSPDTYELWQVNNDSWLLHFGEGNATDRGTLAIGTNSSTAAAGDHGHS